MPKRRQKTPRPVHTGSQSLPAGTWLGRVGVPHGAEVLVLGCAAVMAVTGAAPTDRLWAGWESCQQPAYTTKKPLTLLLRASPSQKCPSWGLRNSPEKSTLPEPVLPAQALLKNSQISKGKPNFKKMEKEGEETQTCADRFTYQRQAIHGEEGNLCLPSQILTACTTLRPLCSVPGSGEACPGSPWPRGERGSGGWPACSGTRLAREPLERRTTVKPVPQKNPVVNSARSNALGFLSAIALCVGAILRKKFCLSLSRD